MFIVAGMWYARHLTSSVGCSGTWSKLLWKGTSADDDKGLQGMSRTAMSQLENKSNARKDTENTESKESPAELSVHDFYSESEELYLASARYTNKGVKILESFHGHVMDMKQLSVRVRHWARKISPYYKKIRKIEKRKLRTAQNSWANTSSLSLEVPLVHWLASASRAF